jgi:hypothetical protein
MTVPSIVRPLLEAMQSNDFRISEDLFTGLLVAAGEWD